ncbi:hypothetical protein, partial [Nitrosomonas sp.]|uniref:HzsA-related protein n=1 Tax=Nitrosomonas sp. TaxID=42353 RepID=UPI001DDAF350
MKRIKEQGQTRALKQEDRMKRLLLLMALMIVPLEALSSLPVAYSQCVRQHQPWTHTADVTIAGQTQSVTTTYSHMDAFDVTFPDTVRLLSDKQSLTQFIAPCNLVLRDAAGAETTIYSCEGRPDNDGCAALDAKVTPDGNTVVFSLFKGQLTPLMANISPLDMDANADSGGLWPGWTALPNKQLLSNGATIYKYNVTTGALTEVFPFQAQVWRFAPVPESNERFAYLSTENGYYAPLVFGDNSAERATQWFSASYDGKNVSWDGTYLPTRDMQGSRMNDGRLAYTMAQLTFGLPFKHNNGTAGRWGTKDNYANLWACGAFCEDQFPLFGQHMQHGIPNSAGIISDAFRFPTQMSDGTATSSDYYRGNNGALGILFGFQPQPFGIEGVAPSSVTNLSDAFMPPGTINLTPFTYSNDQTSPVIPGYPKLFAGKAGYPAATPNNGLMFTYGAGGCSSVLMPDAYTEVGQTWSDRVQNGAWMPQSTFYDELEQYTGGTYIPACDAGIYLANVLPMTGPADMTVIVDRPEYHEIMPVAVVPWSAIHGDAAPTVTTRPDLLADSPHLEKGTPRALLGSASVFNRQTEPCDGFGSNDLINFHACGTDMVPYTDADIAAVRIIGGEPNPAAPTPQQIANAAGVSAKILTEVPIESDGSFAVLIPGDMPYTLQLIDADGNPLNLDQFFGAEKPGQQQTCGGCHFHSAVPPSEFSSSIAGSPGYIPLTVGNGTVQRVNGRDANGDLILQNVQANYVSVHYDDVQAVFDQFCVACHTGSTPAGGLDLSIVNPDPWASGTTWSKLTRGNYDVSPPLNRPWLSKYIKAFNPLGSLIYWKAKNQRTDGFTDTSFSNDVDFGADHQTAITPEGLKSLSDWIALGSPAGSLDKGQDRQPPTLAVRSDVVNGEITGFKVGTADAGSGVDANSLYVCIKNGATCNNIAPVAVPGGVTQINLAANITDMNSEVYFRVDDNSGNRRELTWTASYLASFEGVQTPPP